jgi:hypothetical protein
MPPTILDYETMSRIKQDLKSNKKQSENLLIQFRKTIQKFFPDLLKKLSLVSDPRQKVKCDYSIEDLLFLSILLMSFSLESRNNYNQELRFSECIETINKVFGLNLNHIPHGDTLAYLWERMDYRDLEKLRHYLVKTIIKGRYLENFRFKKTYLVVFDGVELYRWNKKHCDNCLYARINDKYQYFHRVLEAKLVCENGFSISIASEFIENIDKKEDDKQDCELKASYRLIEKVKKLFPRLPITLLADSLYPNQNMFEKCLANKWNFIFVLKDTVLKSVWEDFYGIFELTETSIGAKLDLPEFLVNNRRYRWINDLFYQGIRVNLLQISTEYNNGDFKTIRAFITNHPLTETSTQKVEKTGQLRWKIENQGFDIQKNHGYNLEHTYSKDENGMKVVYLLIQIAHIIDQIFLKSDLLEACKGMSLKSCFKKMLEIIHQKLSDSFLESFEVVMKTKYQARFEPP